MTDPKEKEIVGRAYRKVMDGQKLTREESAAIARFEKEKEERARWQYYNSIPQKHWRQMSGRQAKVINEQAVRYGIPFGGPNISLPAVVRALHDFLADNKSRLAVDGDVLMSGSSSPALERYREERAALARLDRLEREGGLVDRELVRQSLAQIAAIIRSAGETLEREFGSRAAEILIEALDDAQRETDRYFDVREGTGTEADAEES